MKLILNGPTKFSSKCTNKMMIRTEYGEILESKYLIYSASRMGEYNMGQSIQEWSKQNLRKTTFKKFEGVWSVLG